MALSGGPWDEILQKPNLRSGDGGYAVRSAAWADRAASSNMTNATAAEQLTAALAAERKAKMDALIAEDLARAARRGGGGGRRGGGGGSGAGVPIPEPEAGPSWFDQLAELYGKDTAPPPAYAAKVMPSTAFGPNAVYAAKPTIARGRPPRRVGLSVGKTPKPTKYNTRLS